MIGCDVWTSSLYSLFIELYWVVDVTPIRSPENLLGNWTFANSTVDLIITNFGYDDLVTFGSLDQLWSPGVWSNLIRWLPRMPDLPKYSESSSTSVSYNTELITNIQLIVTLIFSLLGLLKFLTCLEFTFSRLSYRYLGFTPLGFFFLKVHSSEYTHYLGFTLLSFFFLSFLTT